MKILITGGCGFLGANLASYGISHGYDVGVVDNFFRKGSEKNFKWLKSLGKFTFYNENISDYDSVKKILKAFKPDCIFHVAGQTAMATSINNPRIDFEINCLGSFNVLEGIREIIPNSKIIYSSSNKVYGDLNELHYIESDTRYICPEYPYGFDESVKLSYKTPYGISKGSADSYFLEYSEIYDIQSIVFRHSSMYGDRQFATNDQGWIGFFCDEAINFKKNSQKKPVEIFGNGKQVRDILYSDDVVSLYYFALMKIDKSHDNVFNIGGGPDNSISLLELFNFLEEELKIEFKINKNEMRVSDQKVYISNIKKITNLISWKPEIKKFNGIKKMLEWSIRK